MFAEYTNFDDITSIIIIRECDDKVTYYEVLGALIESIDFSIEDVNEYTPLGVFQCWGNDYGSYPFRIDTLVYDFTPTDMELLRDKGYVVLHGIED